MNVSGKPIFVTTVGCTVQERTVPGSGCRRWDTGAARRRSPNLGEAAPVVALQDDKIFNSSPNSPKSGDCKNRLESIAWQNAKAGIRPHAHRL